jgi:hypothetical protein
MPVTDPDRRGEPFGGWLIAVIPIGPDGGVFATGGCPTVPGGNFVRRGLSCASSAAFRLRLALGDAAFAGLLVAMTGDE